jgi:hypothetical protein
VKEHEEKIKQLQQDVLKQKASMDQDLQAKLEQRRKKKQSLRGTVNVETAAEIRFPGSQQHRQEGEDAKSPDPPAAAEHAPAASGDQGDSSADSSGDFLLLIDEAPQAAASEPPQNSSNSHGSATLPVPQSRGGSSSPPGLLLRTPRTATRELLNIDLETWLERGTSKDIFDCAQRRSAENSPMGKGLEADRGSPSSTQTCPESAASTLSQGATNSNCGKSISTRKQLTINQWPRERAHARPTSALAAAPAMRPSHQPIGVWGAECKLPRSLPIRGHDQTGVQRTCRSASRRRSMVEWVLARCQQDYGKVCNRTIERGDSDASIEKPRAVERKQRAGRAHRATNEGEQRGTRCSAYAAGGQRERELCFAQAAGYGARADRSPEASLGVSCQPTACSRKSDPGPTCTETGGREQPIVAVPRL